MSESGVSLYLSADTLWFDKFILQELRTTNKGKVKIKIKVKVLLFARVLVV